MLKNENNINKEQQNEMIINDDDVIAKARGPFSRLELEPSRGKMANEMEQCSTLLISLTALSPAGVLQINPPDPQ